MKIRRHVKTIAIIILANFSFYAVAYGEERATNVEEHKYDYTAHREKKSTNVEKQRQRSDISPAAKRHTGISRLEKFISTVENEAPLIKKRIGYLNNRLSAKKERKEYIQTQLLLLQENLTNMIGQMQGLESEDVQEFQLEYQAKIEGLNKEIELLGQDIPDIEKEINVLEAKRFLASPIETESRSLQEQRLELIRNRREKSIDLMKRLGL